MFSTCERCAQPFIKAKAEQRFCSRSCGTRTRTKLTRSCEYCGNQFSAYPSQLEKGDGRFCSYKCCGAAKRRYSATTHVCEGCGTSFTRIMYREAKHTFCSKACRKEPRETRPCRICGQRFTLSLAHSKDGKEHFCSRECGSKAHRNGRVQFCEACAKEMYVQPSKPRRWCSQKCIPAEFHKANAASLPHTPTVEQRKKAVESRLRNHVYTTHEFVCEGCGQAVRLMGKSINRQRRFCSRPCFHAYARLHPEIRPFYRGGRDPYYGPNWRHQARLARERDNHTCQKCGRHQMRPLLDVHHIIPRRAFGRDFEAMNDLGNLTTICKPCHLALEGKIRETGNWNSVPEDRRPKSPPRGEQHAHAKLRETDIREIRARSEQGETRAALAREFGVSDINILQIVRRRTWAHVD